MIYKTAITPPTPRRRRRPRAHQGVDVLGGLRADEADARQLADDLAALVQAGVIEPLCSSGELRFAACEPDRASR